MLAINVYTTKLYSLCVRILLTDWSSEVTSNALQMHSTPFLIQPHVAPNNIPLFLLNLPL